MPISRGPITLEFNGKYLGMAKLILPNQAQVRAYNEGWRAWERIDISNKDSLCSYPIGHPVVGLRQHWFEGLYDNKFSKYLHIPTDSYEHSTNSQAKTKNMGKRPK